jgi:hypothetical protein
MNWDRIEQGMHERNVDECGSEILEQELDGFWRLFARDVLSKVSTPWDYLLIDVRAVDGSLGIYPLQQGVPAARVAWAALGIYNLAADVEGVALEDYSSEKDQEIAVKYAKSLIESARRVNLPHLVKQAGGILLRCVAYAEDEKTPILEERIAAF